MPFCHNNALLADCCPTPLTPVHASVLPTHTHCRLTHIIFRLCFVKNYTQNVTALYTANHIAGFFSCKYIYIYIHVPVLLLASASLYFTYFLTRLLSRRRYSCLLRFVSYLAGNLRSVVFDFRWFYACYHTSIILLTCSTTRSFHTLFV